jgi:hypothetical protein
VAGVTNRRSQGGRLRPVPQPISRTLSPGFSSSVATACSRNFPGTNNNHSNKVMSLAK